jgi:hypothetical protein
MTDIPLLSMQMAGSMIKFPAIKKPFLSLIPA